MKCLKLLAVTSSLLVFFACGSPPKNYENDFSISYEPYHATSFYLEKKGAEKRLHVFNPWQGAKDMELIYHLYPRNDSAGQLPMNFIPIPVQRAVCLSTTHIAYIDCIQQTHTIVGVSGIGYVTNPIVQKRFNEGSLQDVGYETLLAYETIAALRPDVVFAYGVNGEMASVTTRLNEMGIRVVYLADYLEENALGKAEYMVAVAAFYNEEDKAIEQFLKIEDDYGQLAEKVKKIDGHPWIIFNAPWRDTWYMPGDNSYMTKFIRDAGAQVIGVRTGNNSFPISLEAAYTYALQADFWLHPNYLRSLQELKNTDNRFAKTSAFINKKVYNNTKRSTPAGGSDFWESGVVCPHIILQDLVHIFHPELLPDHELVYYEKLP